MSVAIIVDVTDVINVLLGTGFLLQLDLCPLPVLHHSTLFMFSSTKITRHYIYLCIYFLSPH